MPEKNSIVIISEANRFCASLFYLAISNSVILAKTTRAFAGLMTYGDISFAKNFLAEKTQQMRREE